MTAAARVREPAHPAARLAWITQSSRLSPSSCGLAVRGCRYGSRTRTSFFSIRASTPSGSRARHRPWEFRLRTQLAVTAERSGCCSRGLRAVGLDEPTTLIPAPQERVRNSYRVSLVYASYRSAATVLANAPGASRRTGDDLVRAPLRIAVANSRGAEHLCNSGRTRPDNWTCERSARSARRLLLGQYCATRAVCGGLRGLWLVVGDKMATALRSQQRLPL